MKILAVCGSGVGTSMIMKTKLKKLLEDLKVEVEEVSSVGLEEAKKIISKYDVVVSSTKIAKELEAGAKKLVSLKNLLDDSELEEEVKKILK